MALREIALFEGPVIGARIRATNPDAGTPLVLRQVSKVGPFDFSRAATLAAVTITVKSDAGAVVSDTIDLSTAADDEAVTVAELVAALTAASITGITASVEAVTGRAKIALTTPGTIKYLQVGGEVAQFAGFGYGYGTEFIKLNTQASIAQELVQKDSERLTAVGSDGLEMAIITRGYRQGSNITVTDTSYDEDLLALLEGGVWVDDGYDNLKYQAPGVTTQRPTVEVEWFSGLYSDGDNQEDNMVGVLWRKCRNAKLTTMAGGDGGRSIQQGVYTVAVTPYKAKSAVSGDVDTPDTEIQRLTIEEYEALNWTSV